MSCHENRGGSRVYLAGPGQPITGLSDTDVEAKFADPKITHNILGLISLRHFSSENRPIIYKVSSQLYGQLHRDIRTHLRSVGESGSVVGGHLQAGDGLEIHHLQHLLGLGVNLDDILKRFNILELKKRLWIVEFDCKPLNIYTKYDA